MEILAAAQQMIHTAVANDRVPRRWEMNSQAEIELIAAFEASTLHRNPDGMSARELLGLPIVVRCGEGPAKLELVVDELLGKAPGYITFLPKALYDAAKAEGFDLTYCHRIEDVPL